MKLDLKINFRLNLAGIRKFTMLLVPLGILVAAGGIFGLVILSGRSLAKQIQTGSLDVSKRLDLMISQAPSSRQWQEVKKTMDQMAAEIGQIEQLARQDTQRLLLSYKIFPKPKETSHQIYSEFGDQFRAGFTEQLRSLNALDAPTEAELSKEAGPTALRGGLGGASPPGDQSAKRIVDAFCEKRAQELSVYTNPKYFPWYGFWERYKFEGEDQAVRDCWYSQMAFWIYEDVFSTVRMLNEGSTTVYSSPVKRLAGVRFMGPIDLKKIGGSTISPAFEGGFEGFRDEPRYVLGAATASTSMSSREYAFFDTLMAQQSVPWTNRTSNADVDVLHFHIGVVVDARSVYSFMHELCGEKAHLFRMGFTPNGKEVEYRHNSITILGSRIEPVERTEPEHANYRYGPAAVVYLQLECEYLFHRSGYDVIQPDSIKKSLSIAITNPAGGGSPTSAPPPVDIPMDRRGR